MEGQRKREENDGGMARRQEKKRAVPYSSDSNLDVNCRLMSRRSGMLLGNHSGIQENEARKKNTARQVHNRAAQQSCRFICTIYLAHDRTWAAVHTAALIHAVIQYKPQVQCETRALRPEQLLLPTANSLFFLSSSRFPSPLHTLPYKCFPTLILILLFHLFLFSLLHFFFFPFFCTATPRPTSAHFWAACHRPGPHHHIC